LLLVPVVAFSQSCGKKSDANKNPFDVDDDANVQASRYYNPIISVSIPDPTVIRGEDGVFYIMGTEDVHNMVVYKSTDLVTWSRAGFAFRESDRPSFISGGMMWAPEANYIDGTYVLYYTLANTQTNRFGVGVACASKPEGPYTDKGKIIEQGVDVKTPGISIDPFYYSENGHSYLFYGCYAGIYYIELTDDGLSWKGDEPKQFAGSDYEGSMIHKHGDYYYYFGSLNGYQTNYQLAVARSKSLLGPYTNKAGTNIMEHGGFELVFSGNSTFTNTGHCSKIITDDEGNDWIFLHAYTASLKNNDRYPHMYKVEWDKDGWPVINNDGKPSRIVTGVPAIKK